MPKITAVARCQKLGTTDYGTTVSFYPDYQGEENKEWANATPSLSVQMVVRNDVAEKFEQGGSYMITFEAR